MTPWLRRNGPAVLITVLMLGLIGFTITRPAWQHNIGYLQPRQIVPYGHAAVLGGVRWQLTSIKPPSDSELQSDPLLPHIDRYPPNGRLVTFVLQRDRDGKPASLPEGFTLCLPSAVAGDRRWQTRVAPVSLMMWAQRAGYTTICEDNGPLLVALFVPLGARISAIDVEFMSGPPVTSPDSSPDAEDQPNQHNELRVVRFDTG